MLCVHSLASNYRLLVVVEIIMARDGCTFLVMCRTCGRSLCCFNDEDTGNIRKTCPCNEYHIIPHFHTVKLGYAGVYIFFLNFAPKHRLWVLVRTAVPTGEADLTCTHNLCFEQK